MLVLPALVLLAQGYRIYPVDDTQRDSTFQSFTAKLNKAAVKRDVRAFRKLCADDIVTGTGNKKDPEEKGWNAFVARWRPADPDTQLWEVITDMLSLGSVRMHPRLYVAPYLVWKFPDKLDPRRYLVLTRDQVVLRTAPDRDSKALAVLSFDVVEKLGEAPGEWTFVSVNGKQGFVQSQHLRSSLTPRAQFAQGFEGWRLVALEVPQN
jgi:hypothetical protein